MLSNFLFYNDSSVFNNRTYLKTLLEFACKKGQIDVVQKFNFSINLNAQHVIGTTQSINLNAQNVKGMTQKVENRYIFGYYIL